MVVVGWGGGVGGGGGGVGGGGATKLVSLAKKCAESTVNSSCLSGCEHC